jgi:hypothetical protein
MVNTKPSFWAVHDFNLLMLFSLSFSIPAVVRVEQIFDGNCLCGWSSVGFDYATLDRCVSASVMS